MTSIATGHQPTLSELRQRTLCVRAFALTRCLALAAAQNVREIDPAKQTNSLDVRHIVGTVIELWN